MANIIAGTVNLAAGSYEVILRPVANHGAQGAVGNNATDHEDVDNGAANGQGGGKRKRNTRKENNTMGGGKRNTRKANNTMEGGKRKLSGYMKFGKARRPEIISAHPEWKGDVVAVAKEIGKQWRALSDAERAKY